MSFLPITSGQLITTAKNEQNTCGKQVFTQSRRLLESVS